MHTLVLFEIIDCSHALLRVNVQGLPRDAGFRGVSVSLPRSDDANSTYDAWDARQQGRREYFFSHANYRQYHVRDAHVLI
jgi:hypothetical protein